MYYKLLDDGETVAPCTYEEAMDFLGGEVTRRISRTELGSDEVSTVFLVFDHSLGSGMEPPVLFETAIKSGGKWSVYARAGSHSDAMKRHNEAIEFLVAPKAKAAQGKPVKAAKKAKAAKSLTTGEPAAAITPNSLMNLLESVADLSSWMTAEAPLGESPLYKLVAELPIPGYDLAVKKPSAVTDEKEAPPDPEDPDVPRRMRW